MGKPRPYNELLIRIKFAGSEDPVISMPFIRTGEVSAGGGPCIGNYDGYHLEKSFLGLRFGKAPRLFKRISTPF